MGVDLLLLGLVQRHEAVENVVAGGSVIGATLVIREVVLHGADGQLLLEAVDLVEEENNRGLDEPAGVADRIEQSEGFLHTVDGLVLEQQLVVLGDGDQEEDGGDILKAMNPLLTLRSLATHVEHAVGQIANNEGSLGDTSGLDTRAENILVSGEIVGLSNAVNSVKVARRDSTLAIAGVIIGVWNRKKEREGNGGKAWWKDVERCLQDDTHYFAESFSWYSRERLKQS